MIKLPTPWTYVEHVESVEILDAVGRSLSFTYFDDDEGRAKIRKRISRELALAYVKWVVITPDLFREPKPYNLDFRIPWTWLENEKTFEVCDGGGQSLGHTYFQTDDADQARQWITKQAALSFVRWVASTPERFKPG